MTSTLHQMRTASSLGNQMQSDSNSGNGYVILSGAKDLTGRPGRSFAPLGMTIPYLPFGAVRAVNQYDIQAAVVGHA